MATGREAPSICKIVVGNKWINTPKYIWAKTDHRECVENCIPGKRKKIVKEKDAIE